MKKIVNIIAVFLALFALSFPTKVNAESLDTINVTIDKENVHPEETIKLNVAFGEDLGAYTIDVAYDKNVLEYVSAEGGTANDNGTRVRISFFDNQGGANPSSNASVTFKAKSDIITSNPTDLSVTISDMASPDSITRYDPVTVPIKKTITVEPIYTDYAIALNYDGEVVKNVEKNMTILITSAIGKSYENTRIIAEATTPENATVKLLGIDEQELEHDIIQSGWGSADGDPIGGKDVSKQLDVRGIFSEAGEYTITLKLIDREESDAVIATGTFKVVVKEVATTGNDTTETPDGAGTNEENNTPETLPKTGNTVYFALVPTLILLSIAYFRFKK